MAVNPSCSVPGDQCSEPGGQIVLGMCRKHRRRVKLYGDPHSRPMRAGSGNAAAFLDTAVAHVGGGCLVWPFAKSDGYGTVANQPEGTTLAHRIVLIRTTGAPPFPNLLACHVPGICHNRACVNPAHLYWGTKRDNSLDRHIDGTSNAGEQHLGAKLTEAQVRAIRSSPERGRDLAQRLNVHNSTISNIRKRKTWAHVQ